VREEVGSGITSSLSFDMKEKPNEQNKNKGNDSLTRVVVRESTEKQREDEIKDQM
jgi:hypothetical protein